MGRLTTVFKLSGFALILGISALLLVLSVPSSGWKALTVQTGSMRPAIEPGNLVLVHRVPDSELQNGDVITYVNPSNKDQTITHRIVQRVGYVNGPQSFIVKGDANRSTDAPVDASQIVGKAQIIVPFIGKAFNWLLTPLGLITIIYMPALAIVISELKNLTRYYKKIKPYLLPSSEPRWKPQFGFRQKLWAMTKMSLFMIGITTGVMAPAWAALSVSATLTGNTISTADAEPPNCNGNNNNNVVINNTTNQTATSGNASNSNNTNGGSATSGNASNSNNTNINVNITNC